MTAESSPLLEELVRSSPDALVVTGTAGLIEMATGAVDELFGYAADELIGERVEKLLPDRLKERHVRHYDEFRQAAEVRPMGAGLDLRARRRDGTEFPVDVSLVPIRFDGQLRVGAFVRDATERRRNEDLFTFVNEITRIALEGWDVDGVLSLAVQRARSLVGSAIAWIAVRAPGDRIVVAAADGPNAELLYGATLPVSTSLAARAMTEGRKVEIADMRVEELVLPEARHIGLGPGLYLPMVAEDGPVGALVLARMPDGQPFSTEEIAVAEVFASAAAIVLALGKARQAAEEGRVTVEHERIARDLHDTVIQRLFALGMTLQATERLTQSPVTERISDTVDSIDEVIREIRETIFDLNRPPSDSPNLRRQVRQVANEAAEHLGFSPRLAFRGPVEAAVDDPVVGHLLSVLREGLANVGRHARATSTDVVIAVDDRWITLTVADDGVGFSDFPSAGSGTTNMRTRAADLGGELTLTRRRPAGTLLQWRVPK